MPQLYPNGFATRKNLASELVLAQQQQLHYKNRPKRRKTRQEVEIKQEPNMLALPWIGLATQIKYDFERFSAEIIKSEYSSVYNTPQLMASAIGSAMLQLGNEIEHNQENGNLIEDGSTLAVAAIVGKTITTGTIGDSFTFVIYRLNKAWHVQPLSVARNAEYGRIKYDKKTQDFRALGILQWTLPKEVNEAYVISCSGILKKILDENTIISLFTEITEEKPDSTPQEIANALLNAIKSPIGNDITILVSAIESEAQVPYLQLIADGHDSNIISTFLQKDFMFVLEIHMQLFMELQTDISLSYPEMNDSTKEKLLYYLCELDLLSLKGQDLFSGASTQATLAMTKQHKNNSFFSMERKFFAPKLEKELSIPEFIDNTKKQILEGSFEFKITNHRSLNKLLKKINQLITAYKNSIEHDKLNINRLQP